MTMTLAIAEPLTEAQEALLTELWQDPKREAFPPSVAVLSLANDTEGLTQAQLDQFLDDLGYGLRCRLCGTKNEYGEVLCDGCDSEVEA